MKPAVIMFTKSRRFPVCMLLL